MYKMNRTKERRKYNYNSDRLHEDQQLFFLLIERRLLQVNLQGLEDSLHLRHETIMHFIDVDHLFLT